MAVTATSTRTRAINGFKAGWIRPPKRARRASGWPGDVTPWSDAALDGADVPAWVSGSRRSRELIARLAFAEASMIVLSASYAALVYAWR